MLTDFLNSRLRVRTRFMRGTCGGDRQALGHREQQRLHRASAAGSSDRTSAYSCHNRILAPAGVLNRLPLTPFRNIWTVDTAASSAGDLSLVYDVWSSLTVHVDCIVDCITACLPATEWRTSGPAETSSVFVSSTGLCRLLPPTLSQRYGAAVATQFLTVTLPSAANQLSALQSPSFRLSPPRPPACGAAPGVDQEVRG
ncbi:hypothetical protein NQZ68_031243 [Dissostichus eleginoides]|nr:hypothetical protein NQZ68_031243 [Dissostichus eleginoides]